MKKITPIKTLLGIIISLVMASSFVNLAFADTYLDLEAKTAILIDEVTGKVMYEKDAYAKMYPASMTKILTALVALDYLAPDELITVGSEISLVPNDSSFAGFVNGENITTINLLRGLLIKSGNETANVIAISVARKVLAKDNISYQEAEATFCKLMNEKAESIGALNSHFTNPHGYHDEGHYTTAYDMAIISREALSNDLIRQISAEVSFVGSGAGDHSVSRYVIHDWKTHNDLLIINNDYYYPYATGIKTGYTAEAGYCISASAEKDEKRLIAVVMFATEKGRLADSIKLFNYGFDYFNYEKVHEEGNVVGSVLLKNGKLDGSQELNLTAADDFICLLSKDELEKLQKNFIFIDEYIAAVDKNSETSPEDIKLKAPIAKSVTVGTIEYVLNGKVIYSGEVLAERDVLKRDIISDIKYFFNNIGKAVFETESIPYWLGGIAAVVVVIAAVFALRKRKAAKRSIYSYKKRRRY